MRLTPRRVRPIRNFRVLIDYGALLCGSLLALTVALGARADVRAGRDSLLKGDWADAKSQFKSSLAIEKAGAALGLAELYLTTGRYPEAIQQATAASFLPAGKGRALCLAGEIYRETGKSADAIKMFQAALAANPRDLRARVYLGITQQETGRKDAGDKTLDQFFQDFNAGKIDATRADQLTYTAMAARRLEVWQDASSSFQDATARDPKFLLANLEWGDLFLLKYRADEAAKCFQAVLKLNKNLPAALVGMARVQLEATYNVEKATKLAEQALKNNPQYVPALALKAHIALDDEQFAPAEALLKQARAINASDHETLTLMAASRLLQDDRAGYEALKAEALKQNPHDGDFFYEVGEILVREHWYAEATDLDRQALAVEPKNANALAALGTGLLREGVAHEKEALQVLDQAFKIDGFNVRTFNTLNLYEEVIAKEYETVPSGIFMFRLNKKESPLLMRYVPGLMQHAWEIYVKKYGFTPKVPVTVELFTERQHYGARTTGLPEIGAQGTCFGSLITAMSPSSAEASWELVLSHELAHVFHLQLSHNRVSRWFTEGLAEYETNIMHPYWKREYGREIYLSMKRGDLWKLAQLSAAFTKPDRPNGVVIAYQTSSEVIHYLAESYGFPRIVEALKLYGRGKPDAEVLQAITGKSLDQLDSEFRAFLAKKYAVYATGFQFDEAAYTDALKITAEAAAKPSDAGAQAALAAAMLGKDPEAAAAQAKKALALDARNPLAHYVLGTALLAAKDVKVAKDAKAEFEGMAAAGADGYAVQVALGRLAGQAGDLDGAVWHLNAAKKWDPDEGEPYALLMALYEKKERRADLEKEAEGYLDIEEHDHEAARLLIDRYAADRKWGDIVRVAPRVIGITPMEPYVHQQYGTALAELNRPKEAAVELEAAIAAGIRKPSRTRGFLARQYLLAGDRARAKEAAEATLREEADNPDAKEVLERLK